MPGGVIAVVGPTAAGKSRLSVDLAREVGGEVVNADSMQLYRGMDIGTAKLTAAERGGVPHHLLDVWDIRQTASVAEYQRIAREAIDGSWRAAGCPFSSAVQGCTSVRHLTTSTSQGRTRWYGSGLEAELADRGPAAPARPAEAGSTQPRPPRSCQVTGAGSSVRWR